MINIDLIRELHCYRKMHTALQNTITECIDCSRDLIVRDKLIKAQQTAEDIYIGEIYEYKDLTDDERIIVALLSFIMDTEISRVTDADMQIVHNCTDWILALQNQKIKLSHEYIQNQINKIFNNEKDSEL